MILSFYDFLSYRFVSKYIVYVNYGISSEKLAFHDS